MTFVSTANVKAIGPMNVEIEERVEAETMGDIIKGTRGQDPDHTTAVEEEVVTIAAEVDLLREGEMIADQEI